MVCFFVLQKKKKLWKLSAVFNQRGLLTAGKGALGNRVMHTYLGASRTSVVARFGAYISAQWRFMKLGAGIL